MDKIIYYFKQLNIELQFIEKKTQLGLTKSNKLSNNIIDISFYKIKDNNNFILGIKRSGRPQYLLFNPKMEILINSSNQKDFFNLLGNYYNLTGKNTDDKNKILGNILKNIRKLKKVHHITLAKSIGKSYSSLRAYENGNINITTVNLYKIIIALNLTFEEYQKLFIKYLRGEKYSFYDFIIHKELKKYFNTKSIEGENLNCYQIVSQYRINLSLAYRYMRIANEELREAGIKIEHGKVNKTKFEEIYRRFN